MFALSDTTRLTVCAAVILFLALYCTALIVVIARHKCDTPTDRSGSNDE
jgi:hypothetical protein